MVQGSIPRDHTIISLQFYTMIGSKIYWVYCDYSLLEAPWSTLLAMLDLHKCIISQMLHDKKQRKPTYSKAVRRKTDARCSTLPKASVRTSICTAWLLGDSMSKVARDAATSERRLIDCLILHSQFLDYTKIL